MITNIKSHEIRKRIINLLELESVTVNKTLRLAKKNKDKDVETISPAYLLGIERIQVLINNLFKEINLDKKRLYPE